MPPRTHKLGNASVAVSGTLGRTPRTMRAIGGSRDISGPVPAASRAGARMLSTTEVFTGQPVLMTDDRFWSVARIRTKPDGARMLVLRGHDEGDVVRVTVKPADFSAKIWRVSA